MSLCDVPSVDVRGKITLCDWLIGTQNLALLDWAHTKSRVFKPITNREC